MSVLLEKALAAAITILVLLITAFLLLLSVINIELSSQGRDLKILDRFTSLIVKDVAQSLRSLNNLKVKSCTPELLVQMQKVLITSKFVKEAGFVNDSDILCNTSSGILAQPQIKMPIDFDTSRGIKIYIDIPLSGFKDFESAPLVLIAESESFYVAIDRSYINLTGMNSDRWQVIHSLDGKVNHVFGHIGIFDEEKHQGQTDVSLSKGVFSRSCNPYTNYCSLLYSTWIQTLERHAWVVSFGVILILVFSIATLAWLYPFSHKQKSKQFRVKSALIRNNFYCMFQPIVELKTGSVVGFEMLSRFKDKYGEMSPDKFIPEIKKLESTWEFTLNQIKKAIKDIRALSSYGDFKLSVNIFPEDLTFDKVNQLIVLSKKNEGFLKLNIEIVEDEVLDTPLAAGLIDLLRENSIQTSIDDFGTGYSNLSKLGDFTCDYIKIDRTFITNIDKSSLLSTLVPQIQQMAKQFGLEVVAEGVETKAQEAILLDLGVQFGQGWLYGKPHSMSYWRRQIVEGG